MDREFTEEEKLIGRYLTIEENIYLSLEACDIINAYEVSRILNGKGYANLTVCPCCHVDDFVHVESCELSKINKQI